MTEWRVTVRMKFATDDVAAAREIASVYPSYLATRWQGDTLIVTVHGEWRKYGAARPLLDTIHEALQPFEEYEHERYGPWPVEMEATAE